LTVTISVLRWCAARTPTLFFADGQRVTGAIPADQLKKLLDGAR